NSFANAVSQASGLVPPGTYAPAQALSAFIGQKAAGPWVLTVADLVSGVSGTAGFMEITVDHGANYGGPIVPALFIPEATSAGCVAPVTHIVNVPTSGQVGLMQISLELYHSYVSDLTIA